MRTGAAISEREARRYAVAAQGLGRPRPRSVGRVALLQALRSVGTIQLDAINVVERTQFLVLFSRLGNYAVAGVHAATAPLGDVLEYWGHAASLMPMEHHALFRWRMARNGPYGDRPKSMQRREAWYSANRAYVLGVFDEIRDRGALAASELSDPRRQTGEWWGRRSQGRQALELLFARGDLAGYRRANFERVYDLPDRVVPPAALAAPTPAEDAAQRALVMIAARALGVATRHDLASYYYIPIRETTLRIAELVASGELVEVRVDGWTEPAYAAADARPPRLSREHATLVSPFDSLIWDRDRTRRVFGFDFRIEVYVPEPERRHGYYVLPLLVGDDLVARFDLKADRGASRLLVRGSFAEPRVDRAALAPVALAELHALREWLGLEGLTISLRGNLASFLRKA